MVSFKAMSGDEPVVSVASLASWKVWWDAETATQVALGLKEHVDPRALPGQGVLIPEKTTFNARALEDEHIGRVAEGLLTAYPKHRQPSSYLLGDALLSLNQMWGNSLLGAAESNLLKEKSRRELALAQGCQLKRLLSFIRTSALKASKGRTATTTYLKSLANERLLRKASLESTPSPTSSTHAGSSPAGNPSSSASQSERLGWHLD